MFVHNETDRMTDRWTDKQTDTGCQNYYTHHIKDLGCNYSKCVEALLTTPLLYCNDPATIFKFSFPSKLK